MERCAGARSGRAQRVTAPFANFSASAAGIASNPLLLCKYLISYCFGFAWNSSLIFGL